MFKALGTSNLDHEKEKLKMIIAIARRVKNHFGDRTSLNEDDRTAIRGYCDHIEKLAFEDEVDLEHTKNVLEIIDEEVDRIEEEIARLGIDKEKS